MRERMKALKESLANVQDRYRDSGDTELLVILDTLQLILNGFQEATGDEKLRQLMRAERKEKYDSSRKNWG
jgi:anion-transporting  ArsA/GET3 family ATPase